MRLRIDLAYDGRGYHGWAKQPGLRTVQGELESALATVLRVPEVSTTCAGRTDAGVHARGQVVHVDVEKAALDAVPARPGDAPDRALVRRVNGVLDPDVRLRSVAVAATGFDARFSALWRRYAYRISDAQAFADPLLRTQVLTWPRPLDVGAMNQAAADLVGVRDFAAFCRRREGATTLRRLLVLTCVRDDAGLVTVTARADAFCHGMVRALTGCLVAVGDGRQEPSWAAAVLAARVRDPAVTVAPARGLTLEEVRYPADAELGSRAKETRRLRVRTDDDALAVTDPGPAVSHS